MKERTKITRLVNMLLAVAVFFGSIISVPANAASFPSLSTKKYIQTYTIKTSGRIYAYTDSSLKKHNSCWIDCASDECRIVKVTANAVQVIYPLGNGKWISQPKWFSRAEFCATNMAASYQYMKLNKQVDTYRRSDAKTKYGYAAKGDYVYLLNVTKGQFTQIIYPLANGNWKMGWVRILDFNRALMNTNSASANTANNKTSKTTSSTAAATTSTTSNLQILTSAEINAAVSKYALNATQRKALETINSRYASKLKNAQRKGILIFVFEGCGIDSDPHKGFNSSIAEGKKRANAMCVVIKANKVVFVDRKSSSLPSTFYKSDNGNKNVPTLVSGIYKFSYAGYGGSLGYYYNLTTLSDNKDLPVVRYNRYPTKNDPEFCKSTSNGIKIHLKGYGTGCQLVGSYESFLKAVGKTGSNGLYIVDRSSFGRTYLEKMNYSKDAIGLIG